MAKRYGEVEMDEDGRLIIDVTKMARPEMAGPRIDVTREPEPIVDALTIDASRPGEFRNYTQGSARAPGDFTERTVANKRGAPRIQAADRSLMERGAGGLRIVDPIMTQDGFGMRGQAAGVSGDGTIVLSPDAIGELGKRQMLEEDAAIAMRAKQADQNIIDVTRRVGLQAKADQGFLPRDIDVTRKAQMRETLRQGQQDWLERNKPRMMMERLNTRDQIMAQAEGSQRTPQVMTQDGVMAGWDPINRKIVSDASGARAMAASRTKDLSLQSMTDDEINQRKLSYEKLMIGDMTEMEKNVYSDHMRKGELDKAKALQDGLIRAKWSPVMQESYQDYQDEYDRRKGKSPKQTPALAQGAKTLGGIKAR